MDVYVKICNLVLFRYTDDRALIIARLGHLDHHPLVDQRTQRGREQRHHSQHPSSCSQEHLYSAEIESTVFDASSGSFMQLHIHVPSF